MYSCGTRRISSATRRTSWKKVPSHSRKILVDSPTPNQMIDKGTSAGTGR